jgi:hypothetical protein
MMGLSDNERYNGIVGCVNELSKIEPFLTHELKSFNKILSGLWGNLLSRSGNSTHWILGSAASQNYIGDCSIFAAAMQSAKDKLDLSNDDDDDDSVNADSLEYYIDNFIPTAIDLLKSSGGHECRAGEYSDVYKIYSYTETYFYYANRYEDKLSEKLLPLSNEFSKLQGLCYEQFSTNPVYLKAWMTSCILDKVVSYNGGDTIMNWFKDNHIHHNISIKNTSDKDLFDMFSKFQLLKTNSVSSNERTITIMTLMGSSFSYEHQHKKLLELIKSHNKKFKDDPIELEVIEQLCNKAVDDYNKKNSQQTSHIQYCNLTENCF